MKCKNVDVVLMFMGITTATRLCLMFMGITTTTRLCLMFMGITTTTRLCLMFMGITTITRKFTLNFPDYITDETYLEKLIRCNNFVISNCIFIINNRMHSKPYELIWAHISCYSRRFMYYISM